jgi:hypothetical protein
MRLRGARIQGVERIDREVAIVALGRPERLAHEHERGAALGEGPGISELALLIEVGEGLGGQLARPVAAPGPRLGGRFLHERVARLERALAPAASVPVQDGRDCACSRSGEKSSGKKSDATRTKRKRERIGHEGIARTPVREQLKGARRGRA